MTIYIQCYNIVCTLLKIEILFVTISSCHTCTASSSLTCSCPRQRTRTRPHYVRYSKVPLYRHPAIQINTLLWLYHEKLCKYHNYLCYSPVSEIWTPFGTSSICSELQLPVQLQGLIHNELPIWEQSACKPECKKYECGRKGCMILRRVLVRECTLTRG